MYLILEGLVEFVPRAIGWAVLKLVTLGRYRGFGGDDLLAEGGLGLAVIAALSFAIYTW